jgi:Ca-activated chloride channel family protein
MTETNCSATLRTKNAADKIALRGVAVHADLVGMTQRTSIRQTFVNLEANPIEAVYTFPVPDGAAVCGFEVITGDRVLTGEIDETEKATETFETAIAKGDAAFSLDRERPDVFTVRVGNLKPKQAVTIGISYVALLEAVDGKIRFTFPTTIAPRYLSSAGTEPVDAMIDGDALNPPHVLSVPYRLSFTADVRLGRATDKIWSPTHAISVTGDDTAGYDVALPPGTPMAAEFVMSIELAASVGPSVQVECNDDGGHYLAVTFAPELEPTDSATAGETVFVIDCSGSMEGESTHQATAAVELCLRSLSAGDRFNVCRFGSTFQMLSTEPLVYSQATLDAAVKFVRQSANLGGTELLAALDAVLHPVATGVRNVILMTDGQVTNEPAVLDLARRRKSNNRMFTFGIGTAASSSLVKGLARVTRGAAEFITGRERIDEKVLRTFARLASPAATDVSVDWGGAEVATAGDIPPVFDGDLITVFGRCAGRLPKKITLSCKTPAGPQSWPVDVPSAVMKDFTIATSWARNAIEGLEDGGVTRRAVRRGSTPEAEQMIRLSKQFRVISPLTTFVAVEQRFDAEKTAGSPVSRRVPVMLARGWGGVLTGGGGGGVSAVRRRLGKIGELMLHDLAFDKAAPASAAPPAAPAQLDLTREVDESFLSDVAPVAPLPKSTGPADISFSRSSRMRDEDRDDPSVGDLTAILLTQNAAGAFRWGARATRLTPADDRWIGIGLAIDAEFPESVRDTARTLVLLRLVFASDERLWKRAAAKAVKFVAVGSSRTDGAVRDWVAAV